MALLEEIRKQPRIVREIMFGLAVITTVSLLGVIWFRSFERNLFALMNPDPATQEQFFAQREKIRTPLAFFGGALESLRAMVTDFFSKTDIQKPIDETDSENTDQPHVLPLSK